MRVNTNVSQRAQQQLVLDNFGGVDFSSSPLLMASNRASFACNLINDNGVNHKRPGWEERMNINICTCGGKTPCICNRINGIFQYREAKNENGVECNILIIYAGKEFYQCWRYPNETTFSSDDVILLYSANNLKNERVQFYPHKDKVYIIGCGDYLVFGYFDGGYKIKPVVDSDVYVPTTSIYCNVEIENDEIEIKEWKFFGKSAKVNDINLLTRKRINQFVGVYVDEKTDVNYYTDSPIESIVNIKYGFWESGELKEETVSANEYTIIKGSDQKNIGIKIQKDLRSKASEEYCNVVIEYQAVSVENEAVSDLDASAITGCRFGTLFGAGGASDRLFLSGNPDYPNADFYSWFDDYTYFTAQSQTVMGSDDVPITGYVRLSDNTLATMKAGAVYEPSVYYRRAYETDAYIDEEKKIKDIAFTKWAGGTGEACISPHVISSLAEDDLILSPNGVFGIVEVNNLQTNNRYMRERSTFINGKLLNEPRLSEAVSFVYKNRYYLAVPTDAERNGAVYVADPRFKSYRSDDIDGSFNYEWWYWENVPARVFANIDGQLWFGCEDGRICRFDDKFTDRMYEYSEDGCATFGNGVIVCNGEHIEQYKKCDAISFDGVVYKDNETDSNSILTGIYYVKSCESVENGYNIEICGYKSDNKEEMEKIPPINITGSVSARVRFHTIRNVCSTWYTPVFGLGATDVLKTLLRMTISVDPIIKGEVKFGYETRDIQRLLTAKVNPAIDFEAFSFEEFSFAADFATSYTVKSKVRKFNYIMFKFISDNDRDCAVNNFKAIYTLTASHRGVF